MWLFDKLFNRKIEGQSSLDHLESLTPLEENVEALKKLAEDGGLQNGYYIFKSNPEDHFEHVAEIPEDYSGIAYNFADDGLNILTYENGSSVADVFITPSSIDITYDNDVMSIDVSGVDKIKARSATAGQVLTADGSGGSSWESVSGGTQLYKHEIVLSSGDLNNYKFTSISTKNTAYDFADIDMKNMIMPLISGGTGTYAGSVYKVVFFGSGVVLYVMYYDTTDNVFKSLTYTMNGTFTDTVTPL